MAGELFLFVALYCGFIYISYVTIKWLHHTYFRYLTYKVALKMLTVGFIIPLPDDEIEILDNDGFYVTYDHGVNDFFVYRPIMVRYTKFMKMLNNKLV